MRCAKCDTDNRDAAKFCDKCGARLLPKCPSCGVENRPDARFCDSCGAALGPTEAGAPKKSAEPQIRIADTPASEIINGERKTVTALFADIKGSTELEQDLDPEEARAIVDPAIKLMIDAVQRYDGYVVQSTGDGIFALFGAPAAHEDHPQRALYAALRVQEELRRYSTKLVADGGNPLQCRVGINTGEVVVRSIATGKGHAEYTPIGHTTNLASRMQAVAPVGSIAVAESTRKLCEGYFVLKSLGPTRVKGVAGPVNVYEVTGLGPLRTRLQRAVGRGLTKFVGRQREMEALKHALEHAKAGRGQIVAAMAEPGVGKSRLFYEFNAISQSGCMVLATFSVSHGKASAYLPVIDLLHGYFKITGEDDPRTRREKVTGRVVALHRTLEDTLPYLFGLLGLVEGEDPLAQMDGQVKKRRTLEAIKRIVLRESLNQPLMVIFEDLHWIDEQTQEFLNLLADSIGTAKVLLLVNYRPEYSHQWNSKTYYTQLRLDPLGRESAEEMLSALLGDSEGLNALKRLIIEKTEGTPFFMEEMVQVLFDEGALVRNGATHLTKPLAQLKIPPTVQAILASRIDRLPPDAKDLLQTLAVIGREFPLSLIRAVVTKSDDELNRLLSDLQLGEFIYEQPAFPDIEYTFKHALTQEVAYNSVLIERRRLLHERAGQAMEAMFAGQLDDHLGELAHHYSRSDNLTKAVEYLGRAGQQALQRSAYADAISSLIAAIDLLPKLPDSPERIRRELHIQLAVGPTLVAVKGFAAPETERAYSRARELCERVGDPSELFGALLGLFYINLLRGKLRTAHELSQQLLQQAQSTNDPAHLLYAHRAVGTTLSHIGDLLNGTEHLQKGFALYDRERHRPLVFRYGGPDAGVSCLSYMARTLWELGYPDQALKRGKEALALAQALSHPLSLAFAESFVCYLHEYRQEAGAVSDNAERVIGLSGEHELSDHAALATIHRGWAMAKQGREKEGIGQIQKGMAALHQTAFELVRPYHLCLVAEVCRETDRLDDGLRASTEALSIADEQDNHSVEAETHRLKGELLLKKDDHNSAQAQICFERAIEIARKQNAKSWELRATSSLARLLDKQGKRAQARVMLADIYNWFTEGFDTADLKNAKALLDELNR